MTFYTSYNQKEKNKIISEGILLINKAKSYTSFDVVAKVRKILSVKKVGHAGTLDPFATGLLVVLIGRYTKLSDFLINNDKTYKATIRFGIGTDTHDSYGKKISYGNYLGITKTKLELSLKKFRGIISQVPPIFSAIKINGQRSYKLARKGEKVKLKSRKLMINKFEILKFNNPFVEFEINSSKGTYIRSIARDIGEDLGVPAHLSSLCRTNSGNFSLKDALHQNELENNNFLNNYLIREKDAVKKMTIVEINNTEVSKLRCGIKPKISLNMKNKSQLIYCCDNKIIALAKLKQFKTYSIRGF